MGRPALASCQPLPEALRGDIADVQGGTTGEGVHLGAMAGTLDLVQRGLPGLETRDGAVRLDPVPLPELSSYGFRLRYRGHWGVRLRLEPAGDRRTAFRPFTHRSPAAGQVRPRPAGRDVQPGTARVRTSAASVPAAAVEVTSDPFSLAGIRVRQEGRRPASGRATARNGRRSSRWVAAPHPP
nr:hypothetical protein StreXyl84_00670 [Streptomyces sp. Xyl84]